MSKDFYDSELLFRAILPNPVFWKSDGSLSSAAFKIRSGENGLSVDRQMNRSIDECIAFISQTLQGSIVSVSVSDVHTYGAEVVYDPIEGHNEFHSLIIRNDATKRLTPGQAKNLASIAQIRYKCDD